MNTTRTIGFERPRQIDSQEENNREKVSRALNWLLLLTTGLIVFGLTMLYSASYGQAGSAYFKKQLLWVAMGGGAATATILIGYRKLASWSPVLMWISFALLLIARFFFRAVKGGSRWLRLPGGITIQPSEFAKIAIILFVAHYCSEHQRTFYRLKERHGLLPLAATVGAVIGAIMLGLDLGTTLLALATTSLALFVAGLYLRYMVIPLGLVALAGVWVAFFNPARLARVTTFMRPEEQKDGKGYQLWNSLKALGSGQWQGRGFMNSRMKAKYLPEAHTDFILSIIGEELGFVGIVVVILLYTLWGFYALRIALYAGNRLGAIMAFALTCSITLQAAINIAVVSGSIPTKGMPAPFISYGGSNIIACMIAMGLLVSIAVDTLDPGYAERIHEKLRRLMTGGRGHNNVSE